MKKLLTLTMILWSASILWAEPIVFAGGILSLEAPEWLPAVSAEQYKKLHPGKRYPQNYHESKDGKFSFYSELDRSSEKKTLAEIHKETVEFQGQMFENTLTWNRKELVKIGGKDFSLLDFNIKDPDGEAEFTFRMIVLDGIVNDQVSHTVVTIRDQDAEKLYVEKFYAWLGLK